ncbi:MAG: FAD-binding oxidoreductase [Acidimicrobiia bacterium]|nr:FAD-binding oxidoreductase [Acidimicrobiia bacterium]
MRSRAERRRNWWGWGYDDAAMTDEQVASLGRAVADRLGTEVTPAPAPRLEDVSLPACRIDPPAALAPLCRDDDRDRALHTYGRSYRDVVRGFRREHPHPPDLVAHPENEADVVALLDWCGSSGYAALPFGGGSSVVGGVEAVGLRERYAGVVSVDLTALDRVLEIDRVSRAARIQGGALGPVLEDQLRPEGLTLRHFPQSFEVSTLGGWLATRSGGHFATLYTHIDDLVESMRVVTPTGISESRRLPGSGAGPSPDRLFLGSEGSLGIITEAWMRLQDRPRWRGSAGVRFDSFAAGSEAVRALSQSGLFPTNCRLLDAGEALVNAGVADVVDGGALCVLGFESADHPVGPWLERALELVADYGGTVPEGEVRLRDDGAAGAGSGGARGGAEGAWRGAFVRAPYTRDGLVRCGVIVETFETACTWDRFPALHASVTEAVEAALAEVCGGGWVTCRFTHAYPDGCAPYFSVLAPGRPGDELAQWAEIKAAAAEALLAAGGTITHHHAVGRDHDPWYRRQRPEVFGRALAAAKRELDPAGILNPDVVI